MTFDAKTMAGVTRRVDQWIREGLGGQAQQELEKLALKKIPREFAADLAGLAWRCQLPLLGIRWLNPIVRPKDRKPMKATPKERVKYAACLIKIGAAEEAAGLLDSVDDNEFPEAGFLRACGLISQWRYEEALPLLTNYLNAPNVGPYEQMVAKVNLAEALIHEKKHASALAVLQELRHDSDVQRLTLVQGKVLELSAQYAIGKEDFEAAEKYLEKAEVLLGRSKGLDLFFVKKWKAILGYLRNKGNPESTRRLHALRWEAAERGHSETVRDCDRIEAGLIEDAVLLTRLYFGSPYPAFRSYLLSGLKTKFEAPSSYLWQMGNETTETPSLDLSSPKLPRELKPGSLLLRLLLILSSDFYRPFRVATLHHHVYPGEYFNPLTSPSRIHEAVKRLRIYLNRSYPALKVQEIDGSYRLESDTGFALRVPQPEHVSDRTTNLLRLVRSEWPASSFSVKELSLALNCSQRTAQTYVKAAQAEGTLRREGDGPKTRYRLAS